MVAPSIGSSCPLKRADSATAALGVWYAEDADNKHSLVGGRVLGIEADAVLGFCNLAFFVGLFFDVFSVS
jgi:hypothetical protein